ncbi:hypothetical protein ACTFIY_009685 [Dictyostelium cf. discoideum]
MDDTKAEISFDVIYDDLPLPISLPLNATVLDLKNQLEQYTGIPSNHQLILNIPDNAKDNSVLASIDLKNIEMIQIPPEQQSSEKPQDVNTMIERIAVDDNDDDDSNNNKNNSNIENSNIENSINNVEDDNDDDIFMQGSNGYERIGSNLQHHQQHTTTHTSTTTNNNGITTTTTTTTITTPNGVQQQQQQTTYSTYSNTGSPLLVGNNPNTGATTTSGYVPSPFATNFFPETDQLSAQNLIDFLDQLYYPTFSNDIFQQYSVVVPDSFSGSFKDALNFAKKSGKLVLTYLHSDNQISLSFILDILRSEEVLEFIKENFVFWVAKITPEAESFLFSLVQFESYPIVVTLSNLGSPEILEVSQGCTEKEVFFQNMVNHLTSNQVDLDRVRLEEEENDRARMIVQEQDQAYEESLRADKEKKEKAEKERIDFENKKIEKLSKGALVPEEPAKGPNSTQIVFKLPDDSKLERRFNSDDKIEMLCNYLDGQGCEIDNYQFVTMYPKKVFKKPDFNQTLKEAGLSPQSILNVRSADD